MAPRVQEPPDAPPPPPAPGTAAGPAATATQQRPGGVARPGLPWTRIAGAPQPLESIGRRFQRRIARSLRLLPDPVLRLAASPYIAGERREQALQRAQEISLRRRLHSTIDVLGEDVHGWDGVREYFDEYQSLVDDLAGLEYANISIKLSALGQQIDEERCFEHALSLVARAAAGGTFVRFDMEDANTTDSTLRIYRRMRTLHDNCGVVLQSRLFRTVKDIDALADLRPNVRFCIGIYREPPDIALQDKTEMKRKLLELLPAMWRNGQHVALATHEEWVIREALTIAKQLGKPEHEVEVQMLLGVPREALQRELIDRGIRVRLYVPYGKHWRAYSMRRLENNPDVMKMVAGNVIKGMLGRR